MYKNERKRAMVYSNIHDKKKRADENSASNNNPIINLEDEIIIGLARTPQPEKANKKKSNDANKRKSNDANKRKKPTKSLNNKGNLTREQKIRQQKRRIIRKLTTFVFFLILIIGSITFFMLSPIFNIKNIEVINNNNIATEQIISASKITLNENMFKISTKEAEKNILSNNYIESVQVKRKPFDKIQIDVKERTATLMLEYGNSYVYINNQGYILEISTTKLETPILKGYVTTLEEIKPGNRLNKEDLERLETVLNIMETASSNDIDKFITQIDIQDTKNYKLFFDTKLKIVYLGECSDLSTQMLYVKKMLESEEGIQGEFFVNMDLNKNDPVFREKV